MVGHSARSANYYNALHQPDCMAIFMEIKAKEALNMTREGLSLARPF